MDISTDKYLPEGDQSGSYPALLLAVRNILLYLSGLFVLTDEEQSKAGIYLGGEGRD
jgi:hypothetical protein